MDFDETELTITQGYYQPKFSERMTLPLATVSSALRQAHVLYFTHYVD